MLDRFGYAVIAENIDLAMEWAVAIHAAENEIDQKNIEIEREFCFEITAASDRFGIMYDIQVSPYPNSKRSC